MVKSGVKSSTLIETLIAMVIMGVVFSIALVTFLQVTQSSINYHKVKSELILREELIKAERGKKYFDEHMSFNGIDVERKITKYEGNQELVLITLTAISTEGKIINSLRKVVSAYE